MNFIIALEIGIISGLAFYILIDIADERQKRMETEYMMNQKTEEQAQQNEEKIEKPQRETPAFFAFLLDEKGSFDSVATAKTQKEMEDLLSYHPHKRPVAVVRGHNMQIGVKLLK